MLPLIASFVLAFGLSLWLSRGGLAGLALDQPNYRSLHARPIPRTGGLALMAGMLIGWLLVRGAVAGLLMPALLFLMAVSFLDDLRGLSAMWRFLAHFLAAGAFVWLYDKGGLGMVGMVAAIPAMVWMTNLYNFMDGSDGLAGGMTLFGFGFYGLAAWLHGDVQFAWLNGSVAAAALAFLCFNFHPARIFLGDAGSIPLGFLAAAFGFVGWHQGDWPLWFPLLVFSPFIVDASVTLLKRLLRGEKVWQAHREHYYQRLVQMGWGHRRTACAEYALMLAAGGSAVWALGQGQPLPPVFAWTLAYALAMLIIDRRWAARAQ